MNVRFRGSSSRSAFTTNSKGPDAAHVSAFPFRDQPRARSFFGWSLGSSTVVDLDQRALALRAPVIRGRPFQLAPSLMLFLASV